MRKMLKLAMMCSPLVLPILTATPAYAMKSKTEIWKTSWYGINDGSGPYKADTTKFSPYELGAAHLTLPFETKLLLIYKGKSVCVPVNDRGPYSGGRKLDVTYAVAERLDMIKAGVVNVTVQINGC